MTDIRDWLRELGLETYDAVFAQHEITFELLPDLTESDIDRLAIPTGPRRRLIVAIQTLRATRALPSALTPVHPTRVRDAERRQLADLRVVHRALRDARSESRPPAVGLPGLRRARFVELGSRSHRLITSAGA
jgi:hypothetical protein